MTLRLLSDFAVLRFHPRPAKLGDFVDYLQSLGLNPDFTSSGKTHEFLQSVHETYGGIASNAIAQLFMQKMKPADYSVNASLADSAHFALSMKLYTHFTSPIR